LLRSLIASGDISRAEEVLAPLLSAQGQRGDIQWMAGLVQLRKGNRGSARTHFEQSLRIQPDALEPLDALIALDLAANNGRAARARIDAALRERPKSLGLLTLAGRVYVNVGDDDAAERALKTAIEIDPREPGLYDELVRLYARRRMLDRAASEMQAAARREPQSLGPPLMLGSITQAQGKTLEAQTWFEKALKVDPRSAVAANNLAWLYAEQGGDLDEALRLALMAREQLPQRPEVNDTVGWVRYKRGEFSQAVPSFKQSAEQDPQNPVYQYHLGLAYAKAGDVALAREALGKAVQRNVAFNGAANAKALLASLQ
jgi:Tfp pilus assembly protein PilF